jgi:hypothetical protein
MKEFVLIKLLDKFSSAFEKNGVDYRQLRMILKIKLLLDQRNVPTIMANSKKSDSKNMVFRSMLVYIFMGFMISIFVWVPFFTFYKMNIVLGMIIFMLMATMVADFSTILLDVRDKNILLPRPVDNRTLRIAKTIHIFYYLVRITSAISGPAMIMCLIRYGPLFFLVMLIEMVLICALVLLLTSLLYFIILRVFDGEKLKDIINYFQIGLSIFMAVAYQFIGRMFDISQISVSFTPKWWNFIIPTAWFAAPLNIISEKSFSVFYIALTVMAVVIPVIAFMIYNKTVVPYFEQNLQKLNDNGGGKRRASVASGLKKAVSKLVCPDKAERAFYTFTQDMISSERKLKLQLYPNLAMSVVMPLIMIFMTGNHKSLQQTLSSLRSGSGYLWIYMSIAMVSLSINFISYSEKYRGAWIYKVLPVENPAIALKGAFKSFLLRFNIPLIGIMSIFIVILYGVRIIPEVILMLVNMMLLSICFFKISSKQLPFYRDYQNAQNGANAGKSILLMLVCGVMAAIHFAFKFIPFGITINIAISAIFTIIIWHFSFNIKWSDIDM